MKPGWFIHRGYWLRAVLGARPSTYNVIITDWRWLKIEREAATVPRDAFSWIHFSGVPCQFRSSFEFHCECDGTKGKYHEVPISPQERSKVQTCLGEPKYHSIPQYTTVPRATRTSGPHRSPAGRCIGRHPFRRCSHRQVPHPAWWVCIASKQRCKWKPFCKGAAKNWAKIGAWMGMGPRRFNMLTCFKWSMQCNMIRHD